jgi:hypothetical protein
MASTTKSDTVANVKAEFLRGTEGNDVVGYDLAFLATQPAVLAGPSVASEDRCGPLFVFGASSQFAVRQGLAALPVPMVRAAVGKADLFSPLFCVDGVGFPFVVGGDPNPGLVAQALAGPVLGDQRPRGLWMRFVHLSRGPSKSHGFCMFAVSLCASWLARLALLCIGNLSFLLFRHPLSFCRHGESPWKNGVNSVEPFRYATANDNNVSKEGGVCQAGNTEPAGEIAKGSPGVCDGQG